MPRVHSRTKNRAGGPYTCGRCGTQIEPGERYFTWSFRYGGTHRRCSKHPPRPSELTQSKLSEVYAAQESVEDALGEDFERDNIVSAVEEAGEQIQAVADEYREAAEAMGEAGYENEERADEVEQAAEGFQNFDCPEPESFENTEVWREAVRDEVNAIEVSI